MKNAGLRSSFGNAFAGLWAVWTSEKNVRVEVGIAAAVVALGFFVGLAPRDWAVLVLTIGLVLAAESINTVIEMVVNLACPEYHQLAKRAKDASAGIVLFLAVISVIIGLLILGPPLIRRLF